MAQVVPQAAVKIKADKTGYSAKDILQYAVLGLCRAMLVFESVNSLLAKVQ